MNNAIKWNNIWLMRGSDAYHLYTEGKINELQAHMKMLDAKEKQLMDK